MSETKVLVAMSGGVDSSVAAALLKQQGYQVVGVTMQIWPDVSEEEADRHGGCCSLAAAEDARRVANLLGIPHYVLNLKKVFEEKVISYFCDEYVSGRTPNPCVLCNRDIKFGALLWKAKQIGAEYVATGHYARVVQDPSGRFLLLRGVDRTKDQSYALYMLRQYQLAAAIFPLGSLTKVQVRQIAAELGLPVAEKPESQEICFVTSGNYAEFVRKRKPEHFRPGPILDTSGRVIGTHRGLPYYTVGQRRGLGISAPEPLYVIRIDARRNAIVVGNKEETLAKSFLVSNPNFIPFDTLSEPLKVTCKIRYRSEEAPATVSPAGCAQVRVDFDVPQRAITPGQSAVFYDGEMVIGGGIIDTVLDGEDLGS